MTVFLAMLLGFAVMFMGTETVSAVTYYEVSIIDENGNPGGMANPPLARPGEKVDIVALYPYEGQAFGYWDNAYKEDNPFDVVEELDDYQNPKTWFLMPPYDLVLTPHYVDILVDDIPDQVYTGQEIEPDVGKVELEGIDAVLIKGEDYRVSYINNINAGTATARIKIYYADHTGPDKGYIDKKFKITPADFTEAEVWIEDKVYTGKAIKPDLKVTWMGKTLKEGVDYTVSCKNNVNVGIVDVKLTGKGNFYGEINTSFDINKKPVTITVANASKVEGKADPAFKGTVKGLVKSGDLGKITYKRTNKAQKPGTYKGVLTATYKANSNYAVTVKKGNFTIKAKPAPKPVVKVSGTPLAKMTAKGKKSMTISWNKIQGAAGYDIFFAQCNHNGKKIATRNVKTIKGNKTFKWTKSGLEKGTAYKAYVRAYVYKNGKKTYVRNSPLMHAYTGNGTRNYTNAKSVTVNKTKVTLKKGKTFKIKAKVNKVNKKKKLMPKSHAPALRYMTTNKKVASASAGGKITAKGKGTCKVIAFAHNGVSKKVKVSVK